MNWIDDFNSSITFIEEHLNEEIIIEDLAKIAYCTPGHYQRVFTYLANMSLTEYIRARRMSLAALDLLHFPEARIIDIGNKYGYETYSSFNRAFQSVHHLPPSAVRKGKPINFIPKLSFTLSIEGRTEIPFRIQKLNSFNILGLPLTIKSSHIDKTAKLISLWEEYKEDGTFKELLKLGEDSPSGLLCLKFYRDKESYFVGVRSDKEDDRFIKRHVKDSTWAVFPGDSRKVPIRKRAGQIITEWLPLSGYLSADGPDIEVYPDPIHNQSQYEIWTPVERKESDFIELFDK